MSIVVKVPSSNPGVPVAVLTDPGPAEWEYLRGVFARTEGRRLDELTTVVRVKARGLARGQSQLIAVSSPLQAWAGEGVGDPPTRLQITCAEPQTLPSGAVAHSQTGKPEPLSCSFNRGELSLHVQYEVESNLSEELLRTHVHRLLRESEEIAFQTILATLTLEGDRADGVLGAAPSVSVVLERSQR